jgi:hypothetical protein
MWDFVMDKNGAGADFLRELQFRLPNYIPSASPQSSSLSPEAGTIGHEWPQCQKPHKPELKIIKNPSLASKLFCIQTDIRTPRRAIDSSSNTSDLYSGGAQFESRQEHGIPRLSFIVDFLVLPSKCQDNTSNYVTNSSFHIFPIHYSLVIVPFDAAKFDP